MCGGEWGEGGKPGGRGRLRVMVVEGRETRSLPITTHE